VKFRISLFYCRTEFFGFKSLTISLKAFGINDEMKRIIKKILLPIYWLNKEGFPNQQSGVISQRKRMSKNCTNQY
jgi:hypothetical protein